jgi:NAD/NADP transhydrogenase beta subunit
VDVGPEADRQLNQQSVIAESHATRAGLLIGLTGIFLAFAATRDTAQTTDPVLGYWLLGGGVAMGAIIFWASRVAFGPVPTAVVTSTAEEVANAKLILIDANSAVLLRVHLMFSIQLILTIAGAAALASVMWT